MLKLKQWKLREDIEHQILLGVDKGELIQLTFTAHELYGMFYITVNNPVSNLSNV